jgi:hypothetical protein
MSNDQVAAHSAPPSAGLALDAHRFLLRTGLAMGNVFVWIFVFDYLAGLSGSVARAIAGTAILYALSQGITIVFTPIAAAHLRKSSRRSLIWGVVFSASAFVLLGATFGGAFTLGSPLWGVAYFAVLLGIYRALYFVPYQLIRAATPQNQFRMPVVYEVLIALMPLFAGLTIMTVPFGILHILFGTAALLALSGLPALAVADRPERFSWPYGYTFKQILNRKHSGLVVQSFFDGLEGAALFLVWPLAVFLILDSSYGVLGIVFTLTLLFILLSRRLFGRLLLTLRVEESTPVRVVINVSGWVARFAAGTPVGVIFADVYSYALQPARGTTVDPFAHEQSADRGSFIDEYTALKEITLGIGRITMCILIGTLALLIPLPIAFAAALGLAAFASGISVMLARHQTAASF